MTTEPIISSHIGPDVFRLNIGALIRHLRSRPDPAAKIAERFLNLFKQHGVEPTQIPYFIQALTLDKIRTPDSLIAALSHDILNQTATLFGIQRSWLDGVDDRIYPHRTSYKSSSTFFDDLAAIWHSHDDCPVRVIHSERRALDANADQDQPMALILVETIKEVGNQIICRYHVYNDEWNWAYPKCRIQLKAIARIVNRRLGFPIPLYRTTPKQLESIIAGRLVPRAALTGPLITDPSLEDYALSADESAQAKETDELPAVFDNVASHDLEKHRLVIQGRDG